MDTGIADRTSRINAVDSVRNGLVCQTSLKNRGRFFNAENRSLSVGSAISNSLVVFQRNKYHEGLRKEWQTGVRI